MITSSLKDYTIAIQQELDALENLPVTIDGIKMKPSQCYHFSTDPPRILYNTNCSEELMGKVDAILEKYKLKGQEPPADLIEISFEMDGKKINGWFTTTPSCYSVVLNDVFFGRLTLQDCKWTCNEIRPAKLVTEVGKQIELHYKL